MTYYLYHILGKKIGVTCDIYNRVTDQQGYEEDEYEVLETSEDIDYISDREIELQKEYGYKVDKILYKNLKPNKPMKINVTEQTTTFPHSVDTLYTKLYDVMDMKWKTEHGAFVIDKDSIDWITKNVKTSMYNDDRSYVYNKAFSRYFDKRNQLTIPLKKSCDKEDCQCEDNKYEMFNLIRDWARVRGIYTDGDVKTQYVKLQVEAGELAKAILNRDHPEIVDGIGDMIVVLTNLAHLSGTDIESCIEEAYKEIASRKGQMIDGTFVKAASRH